MMKARVLFPLMLSMAAALIALTPSQAEADVLLGANLELAVPVGDDFDRGGLGVGVDVFLGYVLPLPILDLAVGVDGGYTWFGEGDGGYTVDLGQILAQVRLGADLVFVVPEIFVGVGYGNASGGNSSFDLEVDGLSWQIGAGIGFGGFPFVTLGLHAVYNELIDSDPEATLQWVDAGLHAKISF